MRGGHRGGSCVDTLDALHRVAIALEGILDAIASNKRIVAATSTDGLMSQDELAEQLGVSSRFVQRHIAPSLRTGPRGKKFYRLRDVEEQLAASTTPAIDRSNGPQRTRSTRGIANPSPAPREVSAEVGAIEAKLRASLNKPRRKSP